MKENKVFDKTACPECGAELEVNTLEMDDGNGLVYSMGVEYSCVCGYFSRRVKQ